MHEAVQSMREAVAGLWPELEWIKDPELRAKVAKTWELALDQSQGSGPDGCGQRQRAANSHDRGHQS